MEELRIGVITREDIKEMKRADSIVFRTRDGKTTMECIIQAKNTKKTKRSEQTYILEVGNASKQVKKAFSMNHSTKMDGVMQTIFSLLKDGDEISLLWGRDYLTNQYHKKNNLHEDALYMIVIRRGSNDKRFEFMIDASTCEDNSARMIDYKERW